MTDAIFSSTQETPIDVNQEMIEPASCTEPSKAYTGELFSPSLYATVDSNPNSECNLFGPTLNKVNAPLPKDIFAEKITLN